jgi:NADPH:quinone reductase
VVLLKSFPKDQLGPENFELVHRPDPDPASLTEGEVLVELRALSVDPYMRGRFRKGGVRNYFVPAFVPGEPIASGALAKVSFSRNAFAKASAWREQRPKGNPRAHYVHELTMFLKRAII